MDMMRTWEGVIGKITWQTLNKGSHKHQFKQI